VNLFDDKLYHLFLTVSQSFYEWNFSVKMKHSLHYFRKNQYEFFCSAFLLITPFYIQKDETALGFRGFSGWECPYEGILGN